MQHFDMRWTRSWCIRYMRGTGRIGQRADRPHARAADVAALAGGVARVGQPAGQAVSEPHVGRRIRAVVGHRDLGVHRAAHQRRGITAGQRRERCLLYPSDAADAQRGFVTWDRSVRHSTATPPIL